MENFWKKEENNTEIQNIRILNNEKVEKSKLFLLEFEERNIYAVFDDKTIRVYQAYNNELADEALKLGKFGSKFSLNRMTWIKPSFLWMMYRSGWATKEGQERILAIDLKREGFDEIVRNSVLSSFREVSDLSKEKWKEKLENSEVRCQWDPDRNIYGNPIGRRAIQLGIKGEMVKKYTNDWIVNITDITDKVIEMRTSIQNGTFSESMLPQEKKYILND